MERELPKIGVGVWIRKNGKYLLGLRAKGTQSGTWCPPGGHLEMNETLQECAKREAFEESSLSIENLRYLNFIEDISKEHGTHYITFYFTADVKSGQPVPEPSEFSEFEWFAQNALPKPLFSPTKNFVEKNLNLLD